jgi:hypothetical protein
MLRERQLDLFNRVVVRFVQRVPTPSRWSGADTNCTLRSVPSRHETIEECRELLI